MEYYAGIDVSLERSIVCVVDATGRIMGEGKVASELCGAPSVKPNLNTALQKVTPSQ